MMTEMPAVTVLMAVHNGDRYLRQAIESVIWQDISNLSVVIVDDGSTDETAMIVSEYQGTKHGTTIRSYRLPYNLGLTAALQYGFDRCAGDYIARQDADDISFHGRLAAQMVYLERYRQVVAVGSRVRVIDEGGSPIRCGSRMRWLPRVQLLVGRNPVVHGSLIMRRTAVEQVGGYRNVFEKSQDLDLLLRLAWVGRIKILPKALYGLRVHADRISVVNRRQQKAFAELARWANR